MLLFTFSLFRCGELNSEVSPNILNTRYIYIYIYNHIKLLLRCVYNYQSLTYYTYLFSTAHHSIQSALQTYRWVLRNFRLRWRSKVKDFTSGRSCIFHHTELLLCQRVQMSSRAHQNPYLFGNGASFPSIKAPKEASW